MLLEVAGEWFESLQLHQYCAVILIYFRAVLAKIAEPLLIWP
jgi:hypothetical protein